MQPWFIWNGRNSYNEGLWIRKLPKITRAPERYDEVTIPGRAGSLIMLDGEDVYDSYLKECTVIAPRAIEIQHIMSWLRGSGDVVFSNEPDMAYRARIAGTVEFDKIDNSLMQARIPFYVEPFKKRRYPKEVMTFTANGTMLNPGDVASKPLVTITGSGNITVTIAGQGMTFQSVSGTIVVDCEAGIVTQNNSLWTGSYTGDFWKIPKGTVSISKGTATSVTIDPRWRWV